MRRTRIYFQENQIKMLRSIAQKWRASVSEVIRTTLDRELMKPIQKNKKNFNTGEWLLQLAWKFEGYKFRGPKDLAKNMDKYLYDRDFR